MPQTGYNVDNYEEFGGNAEYIGGVLEVLSGGKFYELQTAASHDYAAGTTDWTLTSQERKCKILKVTNASGGVNAILNTDTPNFYVVDNQSGQALTVKNATGSGIVVASTKRAILWNNGTDVVRITADA